MPEGANPFEGLRGVKSFRATIVGAAGEGMSLGTLLDKLRAATREAGGRWTQATERAVSEQYSREIAAARKNLSLSRVRSDAALSARWINFAELRRPMAEFGAAPRYRLKYHVTGNIAGVDFQRWKTSYYEGLGDLPATIGDLREHILDSALLTETEDLTGSTLKADEVSISAL